ncbi:MAG: PAS domain-containing sensor histidine kinase [Myxococcota bacterium]
MTRKKTDLEIDGERFRALSLSSFDMLSEVDAQGRVTYVSPNHARLHGREPAEMLDQLGATAVVPEDRPIVAAAFSRLFARGENARAVFRTRDEQGDVRWVECTGTPVKTPEGETRALLLSRDVTEQKRLEAEMHASRERFQSIAENAYDMIAEIDEQGRVLFANDQTLRTLGLERGGSWTEDPFGMVHEEDRERVETAIRLLVETGSSPAIRYRVVGEGGARSIEARYRRFVNSDGEVRFHVIARDVSESVESERLLAASEARYRMLVENSAVGILVVQDGDVVFSNQRGAEVCGAEAPEDLVGRSMLSLLHPEDAITVPRLLARVEAGEHTPDLIEVRLCGLDGQMREVVATGSIIDYEGAPAYQGIVRDVTKLHAAERERQRLELQLQEARKLESLGMLAGGIAHDFNNLLAVILANTRFARQQAAGEDVAEALSDAVDAADQAARLTRQLLDYAGRRSPDVRSTDLTVLTRSSAGLLASALPDGVTLELDLDPALPSVRADVVQLEQVLMNLVINAGDAMAEQPGAVRVATGVASVPARRIARWSIGSDQPAGHYVYLEVADGGVGMDAETRQRVFEPFFTTKREGHGLGLAAVLGMVRGHAGGVELTSEPGDGTCFRVFLPVEPTRSESGAVVLLADPAEPAVLEVLGARGLAVLTARDLDAAGELLRLHGEEVEAAVCAAAGPADLERAGWRLREIRPGLPLLLLGSVPPVALATLRGHGPTEVADDSGEASLLGALEALLGKDGGPTLPAEALR